PYDVDLPVDVLTYSNSNCPRPMIHNTAEARTAGCTPRQTDAPVRSSVPQHREAIMIPRIRNYTKGESELLTQVDRGTPMGDLFRRYWWPINVSHELKDKPTFVRLFGEDLVLFRDRQGRPGLVEAKCAHRRANLCFGTTTNAGIRCRYH